MKYSIYSLQSRGIPTSLFKFTKSLTGAPRNFEITKNIAKYPQSVKCLRKTRDTPIAAAHFAWIKIKRAPDRLDAPGY